MSLGDTHDWEMLDTAKLTVCMADIKNTILKFQSNINERLDDMDTRLKKVEQGVQDIGNTIQTNYKQYERNKVLYMEILQRLSVTNERVKPLLDELNRNTLEIQNKFCNPFIHSSRVYNRFWRASVVPTSILQPVIENKVETESSEEELQ